jgi:hypothetical protein
MDFSFCLLSFSLTIYLCRFGFSGRESGISLLLLLLLLLVLILLLLLLAVEPACRFESSSTFPDSVFRPCSLGESNNEGNVGLSILFGIRGKDCSSTHAGKVGLSIGGNWNLSALGDANGEIKGDETTGRFVTFRLAARLIILCHRIVHIGKKKAFNVRVIDLNSVLPPSLYITPVF